MKRSKLNYQKIILFIVISLLFAGCGSNDQKQSLTNDIPVILQGTYEMLVKTDTADILFQFQLVTAVDSAVYGVIISDTIDYEAPMALDSATTDSLFFHYYTSQLSIKKQSGDMQGQLKTWQNQKHPVIVKQTSDSASEALLDSRKLLPIKLDIEVPSFAWAAPRNSEALYFVSENHIYLANLKDQVWQTDLVAYDTSTWEFYSIGLNSDQSKLIAHGKPKKDGLPHLGRGDYYEVTLSGPRKVSDIKHLASISTDSYDIFPSYTLEGHILVSTWGEYENLKTSGKGDIFLAEANDNNSFSIKALDEDFNSELPEAGAFMDREARFILFHQNNYEKNLPDRIHISYRQDNGWSEPEVLGPPVNRGFNWTYGPRIDPEGKYLFFNSGFRGRSEIFRVPTEDIPELSPFFN